MARRGGGSSQRAAPARKPGKHGGGLFTGLLTGLVVGLLAAAALAWYFYARPSQFKTDPSPIVDEPAPRPRPEVSAGEPPPLEISPPPKRSPEAAAKPDAAPAAGEPPYSFYDILPGDKPSQPPKDLKLPREVWWLQVAALKGEKDAQALKARLALLGLAVKVNRVDSAAGPLHRVRVGPFKTEDDALGALDTLAVNNFEPRLFKEQLKP